MYNKNVLIGIPFFFRMNQDFLYVMMAGYACSVGEMNAMLTVVFLNEIVSGVGVVLWSGQPLPLIIVNHSKEGNVLFNDALNTFYLRLYGVTYGKGALSEKANPLPPHGLFFPISSKGSFMHHPTDRITHTTAFVTPVVEHWLEREIAQWVHHSRSSHNSITTPTSRFFSMIMPPLIQLETLYIFLGQITLMTGPLTVLISTQTSISKIVWTDD